SNLGLIPRGSASADLKPSKSSDFEWPRKTSESFSWRLKLPVAKRKNLRKILCAFGTEIVNTSKSFMDF
ncbi:MAG: hypothetical protein Q8N99_04930, partial [Nanoarchaeota archaeon]|nr:hypothetical protein [Nanoarchaeota archaeon]